MGGGRGGLNVAPLASAAARFLASADGPRIAVLDAGGWDTHANQGGAQGPLALRLRGLDAGLQMLKTELGAHWRETTVLVVTEFGRTVAVNGTRGTDHGTAGCAFLAGGAVAAAASSPTGRGSPRATCTKAATCARRRTCAHCSRPCCTSASASPKPRSRAPSFPPATSVEPLEGRALTA